MPKTVHEIDDVASGQPQPLVGALLRRPFLAARAHIVSRLHEAGYTDLQAAHLAVFQHPGPHGRSPGDIARAAGASKQAMNNLLAQVERAGYITRTAHPTNGRERVVQLTEPGREVISTIRASVIELERRWRQQLGSNAYTQLHTQLRRLNEALEPDHAPVDPNAALGCGAEVPGRPAGETRHT